MAEILVVEDDNTIREMVALHLTRAGHHVVTATDGVDGLERFREHPPQLVVLDLMLPRLAGLDLLRVLRDQSQVAVIVISARDSEPDKLTGFDFGADDYLTKPFSMRELVARTEAVLRRSISGSMREEEASSGLTFGDGHITVDIARHEVRRDGELVELSPKQFELLAYLVQHPNQVRTRDQILEAVWGFSYGGETRTIDVHMHGLRRLLEEDPAHPRHLVTLRQYGYKFVPAVPEPSRA